MLCYYDSCIYLLTDANWQHQQLLCTEWQTKRKAGINTAMMTLIPMSQTLLYPSSLCYLMSIVAICKLLSAMNTACTMLTDQMKMSYKESFPKLRIGKFGRQLQAFIADMILWPLVPCKQNCHLKCCYFQVKLPDVIRKCYLHITSTQFISKP